MRTSPNGKTEANLVDNAFGRELLAQICTAAY